MWQVRLLLPGGHGRVNRAALTMAVSHLEGGGPAEGYKGSREREVTGLGLFRGRGAAADQ